MTALSIEPRPLQEQARVLRYEFPEVFDYLEKRDEKLRKALGCVPSPADVELSATCNHRRYIQRTIEAIGPGIADLVHD